MIDSWHYAACVKYHQELLNSHHLVYNIIGTYWFSLFQFFKHGIEAISVLNIMNAFAATASLFVLYACLLKLKTERESAFWLSLFCGVSFGFMRYATDAETYILPLLFSLLATYFFICSGNTKHLILSGLFATIAILVHQLHIWWAISICVFLLIQKPFKYKQVLFFGLPFLLIPCAYYAAFRQIDNNTISFIQFITGEYSKGNATIGISFSSFMLTIVSFIRTFIQMHGQILYLFNQYFLKGVFIIICCMVILFFSFKNKNLKLHLEKRTSSNYSICFLMAFILHLLFAFLSSGNAEFMVMLPFLMVLYTGSRYRLEKVGFIKTVTVLMLVWNLSVAILPHHLLNINKVDRQVGIIKENTNAYFLWKNKPLVENVLTYHNGFRSDINFISEKTLDKKMLDSLLDRNEKIYTDIPNAGATFSRDNFLSDNNTKEILARFQMEHIDSFENLYGKNYIYLIQKKRD